MTSTVLTRPTITEPPALAGRAGKYLVFALGREEYAIQVFSVLEIIRLQEITRVPNTPPHVKGVINLRGKVIAVVDLRAKFGLGAGEDTRRTCVIVTQVHFGGERLVPVGVIVDGVSEVLTLKDGDIEDTPSFGSAAASYLLGMAKTQDRVRILVDLDRMLATQDLGNLQNALRARA